MLLQSHVEKLVESSEATVPEVERVLFKYSKVLPSSNAILARLKYNLCGCYGRSEGYLLPDLNKKQLLRKRQLCEEVLSLLDTLQPGFSCRRGMILYEYHTILLILGKMNLSSDKKSATEDLRLSLKYLHECLEILSLQSKSTFPGKLFTAVNQTRSDIEDFIQQSIL